MTKWLAKDYSQGYITDYKPFNFVDGEGVRCSLYVSGCLFKCPGCFNKETWDFNHGFPYDIELENQILDDLSQDYVQGLTLLGGEPFLNTNVCNELVAKVKERLPEKDIWCWTGYTFEQLLDESEDKIELLNMIDILVDGKFEIAKKDLSLQFRGSSNQRIIDVQKSLKLNEVVIWNKLEK